jgi:hypothetical protein
MSILVFKTDTTGLVKFDRPLGDPSQPRMVKLGAILFDAKREEAATMCALIRPEGWTSSDGARAKHDVSPRRAELYGVRARAALGVFMDLVRSAGEIVAYSEEFASRVIDIELDRIKAAPPEWRRPGLTRRCALVEAAQVANGGKAMKFEAAVEKLAAIEFKETVGVRAVAALWWGICDRRAA